MMKSKTRLDSAVFQLTPTRTRCDLFIVANEKKEKVASGLLNPFLAHLKTAQDQIAKGGYSVLLEPEPGSNATWFTKGTVESFVRFVSTPEILERVYTIESEILQIEEAIAIQGNNGIEMEDHQIKCVASNEGTPQPRAGNKPIADSDEEKAIVLYSPGGQPSKTTDLNAQEGNSKIQLLKVLETRKKVLQKEQSMACARAVAAGFAIDRVADLVSFAECFGAVRLMNAGLRFIDFWKKKHESGQWLEIEAADTVSSKLELSATNATGIMLSSMTNRHKESRNEVALETDEKTGSFPNAGSPNPAGQPEYYPGHFSHPVFPPWAMHSPPGVVPVYQAYPMQGIPYYQNYPGNDPSSPLPYPSMEDPHFSGGYRTGQKRQSMDNRDCTPVSEPRELDSCNMRSQNGAELENEGSSHKKAGKSSKKKSGMVVIRNINYITSKRQNSAQDESGSESESESASGSDIDETAGDSHKGTLRSSKRNGNQKKPATPGKDETFNGEADGNHWQAFQSYLLKGPDEDSNSASEGMFVMERDPQMKRRQKTMVDDPLANAGQGVVDTHDVRRNGFEKDGENLSILRRASHNDVLISKAGYVDGKGPRIDVQSYEANGRKLVYRSTNDEFLVSERERANQRSLSDPLAENGCEGATAYSDRRGLHSINDETFVVSLRSMSVDQGVNDNRTAINMESELKSRDQNAKYNSNGINNQVVYEPHDLSLMPERGLEKRSVGYDPALDYEAQLAEDSALHQKKKEALTDVKQGSKSAEKNQGAKANKGTSDKKTAGPVKKAKPSKMSPLEDARARAEKLRSFKADLQKMKKEQQDAERRRLEALKVERQKRITARAHSMAGQTQTTLPTRKPLPSKLSPVSHRGSKFSDSEPGSSSPLQRSKIRTNTLGSSDPNNPSTCNKSIDAICLSGNNNTTRPVASLSETKKKIVSATPDSKASMAHIRRLSEPRKISSHTATPPVKARSAEPVPKPKPSNGPESKKVSAILNLDRNKAATLPELKIKTSKVSLNESRKISAAKTKEEKPTLTSEDAKSNLVMDRLSHQMGEDYDSVVEKTVVMLGNDQPSNSVVHAAKEPGVTKECNSNHGRRENIEVDYASIHEVPLSMDVVDKGPISIQSQKHPGSPEVRKTSLKDELAEDQSTNSAEKNYQAPFARVSSFEDSCRKLDFGEAPQTSFDVISLGGETSKAYISDLSNSKLEKIPEFHEKTPAKETKGFRRLLKLGKKSHSPSGSMDGSRPDDVTLNAATSGEVNTLKKLISQDETPAAGSTLQKSSRHFSLFSPFRSKTSEKKVTT